MIQFFPHFYQPITKFLSKMFLMFCRGKGYLLTDEGLQLIDEYFAHSCFELDAKFF